jgi:predicted PurR-regulated permease PerM
MEFVIALLILSLLFLASVVVIAVKLFQALSKVAEQMSKVTSQQVSALKHLANLLASKDPLAFQQIQTVTAPDAPVKSTNEWQGIYLPADELELLESRERELDALWKNIAEDTDE